MKPEQLQPTNPEFEQAVKGLTEPKKDGRGGVRPGAGRPQGVTDEFAAVNRLPEKANLAIVPVIEIPFDLWAQAMKLPELALGKDEAKNLALPITQLLEYYFPGRIPEIAWIWLMLFASTSNILKPRLKIISERKKAAGTVATGGVPGARTPTSQASTTGSDMVKPASGYVKAT